MHGRNGFIALAVALLATAAALALQPGRTAQAATHTVTVGNNFYDPTSINVNVGDTVEWDWPAAPNDTPHTVTSDSGTLLHSPTQMTGTYSVTFDSPGTFAYHCEIHGSAMSGTVVVQAAAPSPTNTAVNPTDTPEATKTASATATPAAAATRTVAATPTQPSVIAPAPSPTTGGGAAPAATLPRTGDGAAAGGSVPWPGVLLVAAAAIALCGAVAVKKRA